MDPTSETLAAAFPDGSRVRAVQVAVLRRSFPLPCRARSSSPVSAPMPCMASCRTASWRHGSL
ncbi:hypothetical protein WJ970_11010 [Achromobacter xylosoxidans]